MSCVLRVAVLVSRSVFVVWEVVVGVVLGLGVVVFVVDAEVGVVGVVQSWPRVLRCQW